MKASANREDSDLESDEVKSPPYKKGKPVEEEDHDAEEEEMELEASDNSDDDEAHTIYMSDDFEEDFFPIGVTVDKDALRDALRKYFVQIEESDGFDISIFPEFYPMGAIAPVNFQMDPREAAAIAGLATLAIDDYNRANGEAYQFVEVEKANNQCVSGAMYYITFKARNTKLPSGAEAASTDNIVDTSSIKTFQAKVWERIKPNNPEVDFCRPKPIAG